MINIYDIRNWLIVILVGLVIWLYFFDRCETETITKTEIVTIPGDTEFIEVEVKGDPIITLVETIDTVTLQGLIDTVFVNRSVDSLEIFKKYFQTYYRKTEPIIQNECEVIIEDSITQNRIIYERIWVKNTRPLQINSNITNINTLKRKLYVGGFLNTGTTDFSDMNHVKKNIGFGLTAALQDKKDNLYVYSYDVANDVHQFNMLLKLKFKFFN